MGVVKVQRSFYNVALHTQLNVSKYVQFKHIPGINAWLLHYLSIRTYKRCPKNKFHLNFLIPNLPVAD